MILGNFVTDACHGQHGELFLEKVFQNLKTGMVLMLLESMHSALWSPRERCQKALLMSVFFKMAQIHAFDFVASRKKVELISPTASASSEGLLRANQGLDVQSQGGLEP